MVCLKAFWLKASSFEASIQMPGAALEQALSESMLSAENTIRSVKVRTNLRHKP